MRVPRAEIGLHYFRGKIVFGTFARPLLDRIILREFRDSASQLLAFERGTQAQRRAVVDGVRQSLKTGFVYTHHDLPNDLLDTAYGMLQEFFEKPLDEKRSYIAPESHGQTGYTGLLVETAASSDVPDWKEMLNWGITLPPGHPLRDRYPHRYGPQVLPEAAVARLFDEVHAFPGYQLTIDLDRQVVVKDQGDELPFDVQPFRKYCLLNGLDDIGLTLRHADKIREYEAHRLATKPWLAHTA